MSIVRDKIGGESARITLYRRDTYIIIIIIVYSLKYYVIVTHRSCGWERKSLAGDGDGRLLVITTTTATDGYYDDDDDSQQPLFAHKGDR